MIDKDKVLLGLGQHINGSFWDRCTECPYHGLDGFVCRDTLMSDLLELLNEQEPRVLTPDEIKNAPEKSVVWLELKPDEIFKEEIYPFVGSGTGWYSCYCSSNTTPMFTDDDVEKYGVEFRCWTSRPTDEQRKAVKWE